MLQAHMLPSRVASPYEELKPVIYGGFAGVVWRFLQGTKHCVHVVWRCRDGDGGEMFRVVALLLRN